jgi:predicted NBD/HSP70 family sugar kinase
LPDNQQPPSIVLSPLRRRIVGAVMRAGELSRSDLARRLGLSRSSLSPEISDLLAMGVLIADRRGASTGGRRGALLTPAGPGIAVLAGVDIDADRVSVALTALDGTVLATDTLEMAAADDPEIALRGAAEMIERDLEPGAGPLQAIGISIAADVDPTTGRPVSAPTMPRWADWPVCDFFAERSGVRSFIDNDVNVLALAEAAHPRTGPGLGRSFIVMKISRGLGCGIVVDGKVFRGNAGFAGDLGHICADQHDRTLCACGNRGCLEVLAGEPAILNAANALADDGRSPILGALRVQNGGVLTLSLVGDASAAGDAAVGSLLRDVGKHIGFVLAGVVSFFNPSAVLVSSGLGGGEDILLNAIRELIYQRALPFSTRGLQVMRSHFHRDGGAVSAAVLAAEGWVGMAGTVAERRGLPSSVNGSTVVADGIGP